MLVNRLEHFDRYFNAGFDPLDRVMVDFHRGYAFDKIGRVTEDVDLVTEFHAFGEFQHRHMNMLVLVCDPADLYFHKVIPFSVVLRSGPNNPNNE